MHSYKLALKAKGIKPIPPHHRLRSGHLPGEHIVNPALANQRQHALTSLARGEGQRLPLRNK